MVYRNNLSRDPRFRRIRFFSVVGGIAVLLAVLFVFQRGAGGFALPVLVLSAFIGYKITRYLQGHKNSYLETFDDHVTLRTESGPQRFCEIQHTPAGTVNPRTLSDRLQRLEDLQIITKEVISHMPPHTEYALTVRGRELLPILEEMVRWSERHGGASAHESAK